MALNIPFRNAYYRFASSYSFLFFISWSLWWSLYAIWLKGHLGLTGTELGTLYSVNQFTSILFMMFYGIVQDKLGLEETAHLVYEFHSGLDRTVYDLRL